MDINKSQMKEGGWFWLNIVFGMQYEPLKAAEQKTYR